MRMIWSLLCVSLVLLGGCKPRDGAAPAEAGSRHVWAAAYDYVASDEQGTPLVQGELLLPDVGDGDQFAGTWEMRFVAEDESRRNEVGPQIGSGRLAGRRTGEQIHVELNPHMADNNVALVGTVSDDGFAGRWEYLTFAGVASGGTFTATRK